MSVARAARRLSRLGALVAVSLAASLLPLVAAPPGSPLGPDAAAAQQAQQSTEPDLPMGCGAASMGDTDIVDSVSASSNRIFIAWDTDGTVDAVTHICDSAGTVFEVANHNNNVGTRPPAGFVETVTRLGSHSSSPLLTADTDYWVRLQSYLTNDYVWHYVRTKTLAAPGAPAEPTATVLTPDAVSVSWTEPSLGSAPSISDYDLRFYAGDSDPADEADWTVEGVTHHLDRADNATTSATIIGLDAATTYRVQVRAFGDVEGPWSPSATVTTAVAPPGIVQIANNQKGQNGDLTIKGIDQAQGFTTGANTGGYLLTSIDVVTGFGSGGLGRDLTAVLATGLPSATEVVATLVSPLEPHSTVGTLSTLRLTAPFGTVLQPSTTYWLVLSSKTTRFVSHTNADGEDAGGQTGWSIADNGLRRTAGSGGAWTALPNNRSMRINVKGIAVDSTAPKLLSTTAIGGDNGMTITLTYDEHLEPHSTDVGAYNIRKGTACCVNPQNVSVLGDRVILSRNVPVYHSDSFDVKYVQVTDSSLHLTDLFGNKAAAFDFRAVTIASPQVTGVRIASDAGSDSTYGQNEKIRVEVAFSEPVSVDTTDGTPRIQIMFDPNFGDKWADYESGSGTSTLTFVYQVELGNLSTQGVAVVADTLELNGGTITAVHSTPAVALGHTGLGHDADHLVDGAQIVARFVNGTLVSNVGTTVEGTSGWSLDQNSFAQGFDTGSWEAGYVLTSVDVRFTEKPTTSTRVWLATGEFAEDGTWSSIAIVPLTAPATLAAGNMKYTPAQPWFLPADTSFWVMVGGSGGAITVAATGNEDTGGLGGWSLHDKALQRSAASTGSFSEATRAVMIRVNGLAAETDPPVVRTTTVIADELSIVFNEDLSPAGVPAASQFAVTVAGASRAVDDVSVSDDTLVLTLASPVLSGQAVAASYTPIAAQHGPLRDLSGNSAEAFSVTATGPDPKVAAVRVASSAGPDSTYGRGEKIRVEVAFSEPVSVNTSGGTPRITIKMDPNFGEKHALYESGSGTRKLIFAFEVVQGNSSPTGIAVLANTLAANGGTITAVHSTPAVALGHAGLGHDADHLVDGTQIVARFTDGALVSNVAQTQLASTGDLSALDVAQGFSTGPYVDGYVLTSVEVGIGTFDADAAASAVARLVEGQIDADGNLTIGAEVAALTYVFGSLAAATRTFAAPHATVLAPDTAYFVLLEGSSGTLALTAAAGEDAGALGGWLVDDHAYSRGSATTGSLTPPDAGVALLIRVNGRSRETTLPAASSATVTLDKLSIVFDEDLDPGTVPGGAAFTVTVGGTARTVSSVSIADDTATLTLAQPVLHDESPVTVAYDKPAAGALRDRAANEAASFAAITVTSATPAPHVTGVAVSSVPCTGYTYGGGDTVEVQLAFGEPVKVTGTPRLKIRLASASEERWADYARGSGTRVLTFAYTVAASDSSTGGVALVENSLAHQNSSAIVAVYSNEDATLTHAGLGNSPVHLVDHSKDAAGSSCDNMLLSTLGVPAKSFEQTLNISFEEHDFAQEFTTGPATGGYTLTHVDLHVEVDNDKVDNLSVKLQTGLSADATDVATLTNPETVDAGVSRFTAPGSGIALSADTTYFLTASTTNDKLSLMGIVRKHKEVDPDGAPGWSISDCQIRRASSDVPWPPPDDACDSVMAFRLIHSGTDALAPAFASAAASGDTVTVLFHEELDSGSVPAGSAFTVNAGGSSLTVSSVSISGDQVTLTLSSPVRRGQAVTVGYAKPASNPLQDAAGNDAPAFSGQSVLNATPVPALIGVEIVSDPGANSIYGLGEKIVLEATFTEPVNVDTTGGTPSVTVDFTSAAGTGRKSAAYVSGSGTAVLRFVYTVATGDSSTDGVAVVANSLAENSGTIRTAAAGATLTLTHAAQGHDTDHLVDATEPASHILVGANFGTQSTNWSLTTVDVAQGFTTGTHSTGYLPTDVEMEFGGTLTTVSVRLATGLPSATTDVVTLTNPSTLAAGVLKFTVPSGTVLEPSTEYWVVIEASGTTPVIKIPTSDDEDPRGHADWTFDSTTYTRGAATTGSWTANSGLPSLRVNGIANPSTAPTAPAAPTATSTAHSVKLNWSAPSDPGTGGSISDYDLRYYAGTSDPADESDWVTEGDEGGPPDPGAATTATITGLSASTGYRMQVRAFGAAWGPWSDSVAVATNRTYDTDYDGLLEVSTAAQLNAIRWGINVTGAADAHLTASEKASFALAFPGAGDTDQCDDPSTSDTAETCTGYELTADIDLDVAPYNTGAGWDPIESYANDFDGNGRTISGLFIDRGDEDTVGLFAEYSSVFNTRTSMFSSVRNLALVDVDVTGGSNVGALAGQGSQLFNVSASGTVASAKADGEFLGGLAGRVDGLNGGLLSAVDVVAEAASGQQQIGGVAGALAGGLDNSYAVGSVVVRGIGAQHVGGLVGSNASGTISNSYSLAAVSAPADATDVGGLAGSSTSGASSTASYWDTTTSGQAASALGTAKTTSELQSPTAPGANAGDTYHGWDTAVWNFGNNSRYPALRSQALTPRQQRDLLGAVALSVSVSQVAEDAGSTAVVVTGRLLGPTRSANTVVRLSLAGTADRGSSDDYTLNLPTSLTISANQRTGSTSSRTLTVDDDSTVEDSETIIVEGTVTGLGVVPAVILLTDNDQPLINLTVNDADIAEGDAATTVTVTAAFDDGTARSADVVVDLSLGGSAMAGSGNDYTHGTLGDITITAGQTSATGDIVITPIDDSAAEGDETILVQGTATDFRVSEAQIDLADNDSPSTSVKLSVDTDPGTGTSTSLDENSGSTSVTVTATLNAAPSSSDVQVTLSLGGSAGSGDYSAPATLSDTTADITIAAGQTSASKSFSFSIVDDTVDEDAETITVDGSATQGLSVVTADITVNDNDTVSGTITLSATPDSIGEGASTTLVTLEAQFSTTVTRTVDTWVRLDAALDGSATAGSGNDYTHTYGDLAKVLIIPAGSRSATTAAFTISPVDDDTTEGDEDITVGAFACDTPTVTCDAADRFTVNGATITLADNDLPEINLTVNDADIAEGDAATTVTVTAAFDDATARTADVAVSLSLGGSAMAGSGNDYTHGTLADITITAGQTSATGDIVITPIDDSAAESDETILVQGTATGFTVNEAQIDLADNDTAPCAASTGDDFWDETNDITVTSTASTITVAATTLSTSSRFDLCKTGSSSIHLTATVASSDPTHTFTGLDPSTRYWARVVNGADGTSQWILIDTESDVPMITDVAIVSKPRLDADSDTTKETYGAGQVIAVDVTWDRDVAWDVSATGAGIRVQLTVGSTARDASLVTDGAETGSGSVLRFHYTVVAADADTDGVALSSSGNGNLVRLRSGATLTRADDATVNADRTHGGLAAQSGHLVAGGTAAPANSAPTYSGENPVNGGDVANAPPLTLVNFEVLQASFVDADGDPLRFVLSASRDDVLLLDEFRYAAGRVFLKHRPQCVLANLTPTPDKPQVTEVTLTAVDPDGGSVAVTAEYGASWPCPEFLAAEVDGTTLEIVLHADDAVGDVSIARAPAAGRFTVKVDGTAAALAAVNPVTVQDATVTLTLASAVTAGQTVTVSYAPDAAAMAAESEGDAPIAAAFTDEPVSPSQAPSVTAVAVSSAAGADNLYVKGDVIEVTVTFDELVKATTAGTPAAGPRVALTVGDAKRWAVYSPGGDEDDDEDGEDAEPVPAYATELVFSYEVAAGDLDADGIAIAEDALELNGGTIADPHAKAASLAHTALAAQAAHKVDAAAPSVVSASVDGTTLTVTFDEALAAAASLANSAFTVKKTPSGGSEGTVGLSGSPSISGKVLTLTLASAVKYSDSDVKVSYTPPTSGTANSLADAVGNQTAGFSDAAVDNDTAPAVSAVAISSTPRGAADTYGLGEAIEVTVTFDGVVAVTGSPRLKIKMDPNFGEFRADYESGSGTAALVFAYEVVSPNASTQGIAVLANTLELNGGTIVSSPGGVAAALGHVGLGHDANHKVDSSVIVAPEVVSASVDGAALSITFHEELGAAANLANTAFGVKKTPAGGSEQTVNLSGSPSISGAVLTLTLAEAVVHTDTDVKVSYTKPTTGSGNKIVDTDGNVADSFSDQAVTNDTAPDAPDAAVNAGDGRVVTLTFAQSLASRSDAVAYEMRHRFAVFGGYWEGVPVPNQSPNSVVIDGDTVTLTLGSGIPAGGEMSVGYWASSEASLGLELADGTAVAGFTVSATRPGSGGPPVLVGGQVEGTALALWFDRDLDEGSVPSSGSFWVEELWAGGPARGTGDVVVSGRVVRVTLQRAVAASGGRSPAVFYDPPAASPLRAAASPNRNAAAVEGTWIDALPAQAPKLVSAALAGSEIVLYYDEPLDAASVPATGGFSFTAGGVGRLLKVGGTVEVVGTAVVLPLNGTENDNAAIELDYTAGTNPIRDLAGNNAANLSNQAVTNLGSADAGKPELGSAAATDCTAGSEDEGYSGGCATVTLTFGTHLDPAAVPAPSAFTLSDPWRRVSGVAVRGDTVVLGLTNSLFPCSLDLTAAYAKPDDDALANLWGTEADSFAADAVAYSGTVGCNINWGFRADEGSVIITARRPFDTSMAPQPEWFTVTASGGPMAVTAAAFSVEDPAKLILETSRDFAPGETATVSYRRPPGHPGMWDIDGNQLGDLIDFPINTAAAAPTVESVAVASDAGGDGTYAAGEAIRVTVTFSEPVEVDTAGGTPTLTIDMDPAHWGAKQAAYATGSGTAELVFEHTVAEPNRSTQGIAVVADSLTLGGGTIASAASGAAAELAHGGLGHDPAHKVDWRLAPPPEPGDPGAPVFAGSDQTLHNALPGFFVSLEVAKADFSDPDGDPLTFTLTADRGDVHVPGGFGYLDEVGRVFFVAKNACALAALDPPTAGDGAYVTVATLTATDPDGNSTSATATFRTHPDAGFTCPSLSSATVDGTTVTLSFDADLAAGWVFDGLPTDGLRHTPTAAEFTVTVNGQTAALADTGYAAGGDTVTLTLAQPVTSDHTVTVTHTPTATPHAQAFTDHPATNNTPTPEPEQPDTSEEQPEQPKKPDQPDQPAEPAAPISAAVNGNQLVVTFNRELAAVDAATASALRFAFLIEGAIDNRGTPTAQSPTAVAVDGATITLTLGTPITLGTDVTVTYWGNTLHHADGTQLAGFTTTLTTTSNP